MRAFVFRTSTWPISLESRNSALSAPFPGLNFASLGPAATLCAAAAAAQVMSPARPYTFQILVTTVLQSIPVLGGDRPKAELESVHSPNLSSKCPSRTASSWGIFFNEGMREMET